MPSSVTVSARSTFGPQGVIARFDTTPGHVWSIQMPTLPRSGAVPAATGQGVVVTIQSASTGLPDEEMAVVNSLGAIMAQPGAKKIRLNVVRPDGSSSGVLGDGRLAMHVHLLETTSRLRYDGEATTYTVETSSSAHSATAKGLNVRLRQMSVAADQLETPALST